MHSIYNIVTTDSQSVVSSSIPLILFYCSVCMHLFIGGEALLNEYLNGTRDVFVWVIIQAQSQTNK